MNKRVTPAKCRKTTMGAEKSKSEEIIIQQQQQQQGQQQPSPSGTGFGPTHIIAACMVVLLIAIFLRLVWRVIMHEIETRPRRAESLANIV